MAVTEGERRAMHGRLVAAIGEEAADTLMDLLPPVGWADIARRSDVDHAAALLEIKMAAVDTKIAALDAKIEAKVDQLENRFGRQLADAIGELRSEMSKNTRTVMLGNAGLVISAFAAFAALVR